MNAPRRLAALPWRRLGRFLERTLALTGAFFIVFHVFFEVSWIATSSMAPLLVGADRGEPDWILIEKRFTRGRVPPRFECVAFDDEEGTEIVKRVAAFAGERIEVHHDRTLWIDGRLVPVPAGVGEGKGYLPAGNLWDGHPFLVPEGHVYVLGDDTKDSLDSRFTGALPIEHIKGRAIFRILPLSRFRLLA
jgi:signal peptidase I